MNPEVAAAEQSRGNSVHFVLVAATLFLVVLSGWGNLHAGSNANAAPLPLRVSPSTPSQLPGEHLAPAPGAPGAILASNVVLPPDVPLGPVPGFFGVTTVNIGNYPYFAAYNPSDGDMYIPNWSDWTVSVLNGTSLIATVGAGYYPDSAVFDPSNNYVYVANYNSGNMTLISGTKTVGSVTVGNSPYNPTYDPNNGYVYVPNRYGSSVSVISGTKVVATINSGSDPWNATYDPTHHFVYVPNYYSATVTVINGTKVAATIPVGAYPFAATYDPIHEWVYVSNTNSNNLTIINGTKTVGQVHVGYYPAFGAFNPENGYVYVVNRNSANVSVINGTQIVGSVATKASPYGIDFNPGDGLVYVACESSPGYVSVINGTQSVTNLSVGNYPMRVAYDPANGMMYTPNYYSHSASIISHAYNVTFSETGLPTATNWSVKVAGVSSGVTNATTLQVQEPNGEFGYSVSSLDPTYAAPNGKFVIARNTLTVDVVFSRVTFPVNFTEVGLPAGTAWAVTYGGAFKNGTTASIPFRAPNGTQGYQLAVVPGWTTAKFSSTVTVVGMAVTVIVTWSVKMYAVQFNETGLLPGTGWWINVTRGGSTLSTGGNLSFLEANGTYTYSVGSADKSYAAPHGSFPVNGAVEYQNIVFSLVLYVLNFTETGLLKGTHWSVNVGGTTIHGAGTSLTILEPNGSYAYTLGKVGGWTIASYSGTAVLHGKTAPVQVVWIRFTYSVVFSENGLPSGTDWSVTFNNQLGHSSANITFTGIPNGTYNYSVSPVSGYNNTPINGTITVNMFDSQQVIAFTSNAPPKQPSTGGSTFLGLPAAEGYGLLGAIVVIGAVAAILLLRGRRPKEPVAEEEPEVPASVMGEETPAGTEPIYEGQYEPPSEGSGES